VGEIEGEPMNRCSADQGPANVVVTRFDLDVKKIESAHTQIEAAITRIEK
jgi:hypothetical protein